MLTQPIKLQAYQQFNQYKKSIAPQPQGKTFNTPSDKQLDYHMESLHDRLFTQRMNPQVRNAMMMLAKGFTFQIPYYDIYKAFVDAVQITDIELAEAYTHEKWEELPKDIKKKITRAAKRLQRKHKAFMDEMATLLERQADHLDVMPDDDVEQVLDFEPTELDKMYSEINYYMTYPDALDDKYLMTPKQIAQYLAVQSKGLIYLTPSEVTAELKARCYQKSDYATAFFVKTI
jgi:hypothetical protein